MPGNQDKVNEEDEVEMIHGATVHGVGWACLWPRLLSLTGPQLESAISRRRSRETVYVATPHLYCRAAPPPPSLSS